MAIIRQDEILEKALSGDPSAVPRYNLRAPDGTLIGENVALELANAVTQMGTPVNAAALNEMLAASGVTAGAASAYTLAQEGFALFDGAPVRFRLHTASGANATLNINGTGAKPIKTIIGDGMPSGIPAGMWVDAKYSTVADAYILSGGSVSSAQVASWEDKPTQTEMLNAIDTRSAKIITGTYVGNGAASVTLNFDFTPYAVFVFIDNQSLGVVAGGAQYSKNSYIPAFYMMALRGASEAQTCGVGTMPPGTASTYMDNFCLFRFTWGEKSLKWTGAQSDTFSVYGTDYGDVSSSTNARYILNYSNKVYRYIAIGRS